MRLRHLVRSGVLLASLVPASTVLSMNATAQVFEPVTDDVLQNPDPADWLHWRRTLDGWGYSPLDEINRDNVYQLQLVWSWQMRPGLSQPTPLVYNGVMYLPNPDGFVQAVDAVTGDRLWEYRKIFDNTPDESFRNRMRSLAIYGTNLYVTTADAHLIALDATTGEMVWDHVVADHRLGYRYTSGAIVVKGAIVAGITGCERYKNDVCFISAHDPDTGRELWRTSTIAEPGTAGGDTWGDLPLTFRAGGDAWIPGSYDAGTDLMYWSTAQAKPWAQVSRGTEGDALYTNSALAIDPDTGELEWYYQFIPGESHDLDEVFESVLIDNAGRRSVFKMGKLGILWEIDAATGEFVDAHDLGFQTLVDVNENTGAVTYRPGMIPEAGVELEFCPDFRGIRNVMATAYHPETKALYIPITPTCTKGTFHEVEREAHPEGDVYFYSNPAWTGWRATGGGPHPLSPDHSGQLIAMDIDSGEILWRHKTATKPLTAALTTGGGLVLSGDTDRYLFIHDVETGQVLYKTRLPSPVQGYPITYAVEDTQYLAIPVGGGRAPGAPNALFVFALPGRPAGR